MTRLLEEAAAGDERARNALFVHVYEDLRARALVRLTRERPDHSLGPTGLVHEVYCQLVKGRHVFTHDRRYFFAAANRAMEQILREHARKRRNRPHGHVDPEGRFLLAEVVGELKGALEAELCDLLEALDELGAIGKQGPRRREVVKLRFWDGLTCQEIAEKLGVGLATVEKDWRAARAWLFGRLKGGRADDD
jgi:RNA polymerase sigma factor (TIGR02999 family)